MKPNVMNNVPKKAHQDLTAGHEEPARPAPPKPIASSATKRRSSKRVAPPAPAGKPAKAITPQADK